MITFRDLKSLIQKAEEYALKYSKKAIWNRFSIGDLRLLQTFISSLKLFMFLNLKQNNFFPTLPTHYHNTTKPHKDTPRLITISDSPHLLLNCRF